MEDLIEYIVCIGIDCEVTLNCLKSLFCGSEKLKCKKK